MRIFGLGFLFSCVYGDATTVPKSFPCFMQARRHLFERGKARLRAQRTDAPLSADVALCFPGQGAQYVGMAKDSTEQSATARSFFEKASEIVGYDLLKICLEGPKERLDGTDVCQPAVFTASMAAYERHKASEPEIGRASVAIGLSLGEYSALCAAGAISFEDGVRITKARGEAMQAAAEMSDSGMLAVIGLDSDKVQQIAEKASVLSGQPLVIANYLCPGNYVLSGGSEAVAAAAKIAKPDFKARMTMKLAVAGAFHSTYMNPAVEKLRKVLDEVVIQTPRIPIISNVDASAHQDPTVLRELLVKQVTHPVRFEDSLRKLLASNFGKGFEIGPGSVIGGLIKRLDKEKLLTSLE